MAIVENQQRGNNNGGDYAQSHAVVIDNREKLSISGIEDVETFDENTIVVHTVMGKLTICGTSLHIRELNVETTDLTVEGHIDALQYSNETFERRRGLFSGLFR
jgi:sporulation protein YabP